MMQDEKPLSVPLNPQTYDEENGVSYSRGYQQVPMATPTAATAQYAYAQTPPTQDHRSAFQKIRDMDIPQLLKIMRYVNVILALFQGLTGILGLFDIAMLNITGFLISVYVIIFAFVLLTFECRFQTMEPMLRKNFGFLFTYRGRMIFIFFVGFLDFGLKDAMGWAAGIFMCANALLHVFVLTCHPSFRSGEISPTMDPTQAYTPGSQVASEFIQRNPELATQAGSFVMEQVRQNPEYATKVASAAVVPQANMAPAAAGYVPPSRS